MQDTAPPAHAPLRWQPFFFRTLWGLWIIATLGWLQSILVVFLVFDAGPAWYVWTCFWGLVTYPVVLVIALAFYWRRRRWFALLPIVNVALACTFPGGYWFFIPIFFH